MCLHHQFLLSPHASSIPVTPGTRDADRALAADERRVVGELLADGDHSELGPSADVETRIAELVTQAVS